MSHGTTPRDSSAPSESRVDAARHRFSAAPPLELGCPGAPFPLFLAWLDEVRDAGVYLPDAAALATASEVEGPAVRIVHLKEMSESGFTFFTQADSRKGRDLLRDPRCELLFPWHQVERQVRVRGSAHPIDPAESDAYFASRPRDSQLAAHASQQSRPVEAAALRDALASAEAEYTSESIPRPEGWGGLRVVPERFEFWQGRPGRLHDRLVYSLEGGSWRTQRLAP